MRCRKQWWSRRSLDTRIARGVLAQMHTRETMPRQGLYAPEAIGGMAMPSMVVERIASVAREVLAELQGT